MVIRLSSLSVQDETSIWYVVTRVIEPGPQHANEIWVQSNITFYPNTFKDLITKVKYKGESPMRNVRSYQKETSYHSGAATQHAFMNLAPNPEHQCSYIIQMWDLWAIKLKIIDGMSEGNPA